MSQLIGPEKQDKVYLDVMGLENKTKGKGIGCAISTVKPTGGALGELKRINLLFNKAMTENDFSQLAGKDVHLYHSVIESFNDKIAQLQGLQLVRFKVDEYVGKLPILGYYLSTTSQVRHEAKTAEENYQKALNELTKLDTQTITENFSRGITQKSNNFCGEHGIETKQQEDKTVNWIATKKYVTTLLAQINQYRNRLPPDYQSIALGGGLGVLKQIKADKEKPVILTFLHTLNEISLDKRPNELIAHITGLIPKENLNILKPNENRRLLNLAQKIGLTEISRESQSMSSKLTSALGSKTKINTINLVKLQDTINRGGELSSKEEKDLVALSEYVDKLISSINSNKTKLSQGFSAEDPIQTLEDLKNNPIERHKFLLQLNFANKKAHAELITLMRLSPIDEEIVSLSEIVPQEKKQILNYINKLDSIPNNEVPNFVEVVTELAKANQKECSGIVTLSLSHLSEEEILNALIAVVEKKHTNALDEQKQEAVAKAYISYLKTNHPKFLTQVDENLGQNILHHTAIGNNIGIVRLLKECEGFEAAQMKKDRHTPRRLPHDLVEAKNTEMKSLLKS